MKGIALTFFTLSYLLATLSFFGIVFIWLESIPVSGWFSVLLAAIGCLNVWACIDTFGFITGKRP